MNEKTKNKVFITNILMYIFISVFIAIYVMGINGFFGESLKIADQTDNAVAKLIAIFVPTVVKVFIDFVLPVIIVLMVISLIFTLLGKSTSKKVFYVISLIPMVLLEILFVMLFIKKINLFIILPIGLLIFIIVSNILLFKKNKEVN